MYDKRLYRDKKKIPYRVLSHKIKYASLFVKQIRKKFWFIIGQYNMHTLYMYGSQIMLFQRFPKNANIQIWQFNFSLYESTLWEFILSLFYHTLFTQIFTYLIKCILLLKKKILSMPKTLEISNLKIRKRIFYIDIYYLTQETFQYKILKQQNIKESNSKKSLLHFWTHNIWNI